MSLVFLELRDVTTRCLCAFSVELPELDEGFCVLVGRHVFGHGLPVLREIDVALRDHIDDGSRLLEPLG